MKLKINKRNVVRLCLLWTLFFVCGDAMAELLEIDNQITEERQLFLLEEGQRQNPEGSISVKINHDLIFSPDSPLRSANQKPVEVKFKLTNSGETIATISKFNFKNDQEYSYIGKVEGKIGGNLFLTKVGSVFTGDILLNNGECYELKKTGDGKYSINKIKINQRFRCATCEQGNTSGERKIKKHSRPSGISSVRHNGYSLQGGDIEVDLLVVYTEAARKKAGERQKQPDNHNHIKNLMERYVNITNAALENSDVNVKINIVHREQVNYQEVDEEGVLDKSIDDLVAGNKGLDDISNLRKKHGADLVCLVISSQIGLTLPEIKRNGIFRGIGQIGNYPSVINIVAQDNVFTETGPSTLAHELGHNFGCYHDRAHSETKPSNKFAYAHGHRFPWKGKHKITIMSYQTEASDQRIYHYSNPDITWKETEVPTGVKEGSANSANNAKMIRESAHYIASLSGEDHTQNQLPVIVETYPVSGAEFEAGEGFKPYVICYDPDGSIDKIKISNSEVPKSTWVYLANGRVKATRQNGIVGPEPNKTYTFSIVVEDNSGGITELELSVDTVEKKKNQLPVIVETYPVSGAEFEAGEVFKPHVICYDPDGTIEKITIHNEVIPKSRWTYLANGRIKATRQSGLRAGPKINTNYIFMVYVEDDSGAIAELKITNKTIKKKLWPVIEETYPVSGAEFEAGEFFKPYVICYDPDGTIEKITIHNEVIPKSRWTYLANGRIKAKHQNGIQSPDPNTTHTFRIIVEDDSGAITERELDFKTRKKQSKPIITLQPKGQSFRKGQSIHLRVKASGVDQSYQWFKNGVELARETSRILLILSAAKQDEGEYTVTVKNNGGSVTSNKAIMIYKKADPPTIIKHPQGRTFSEGDIFELFVDASGTDLEYQWYKEGNIRPIKLLRDTKSKLTFKHPKAGDAGEYYAVVKNEGGAVTSNIAYMVYKTVLPTGPLTYKVSGNTVTITDCKTSATGDLVIPSTYEGKLVTSIGSSAFKDCSSLKSVTIANSVVSIASNAFRRCSSLKSVTIPDSVTSIVYWAFKDCSSLASITFEGDAPSLGADVFIGVSDGAKIFINPEAAGFAETFGGLPVVRVVVDEPKIILHPQSISVDAGMLVELEVEAEGDNLKYQWFKDNVKINGAMKSEYVIFATFSENVGEYYVTVSNESGEVTSDIVLIDLLKDETLKISAFKYSGQFQFDINGRKGATFLIEASSDLKLWHPISEFKNNDGTVKFSDPTSPLSDQRFYRVKLVE
jgi:hypothetical protein